MVFCENLGSIVWTSGMVLAAGVRFSGFVPILARINPFVFWGASIVVIALTARKIVAGPPLPKNIENMDLTGKTIIVTGSAAGLGYQSTKYFAQRGATVILGARSVKRNEETAQRLSQEPELKGKELKLITRFEYEAEDLSSVKKFAENILAANKDTKIDVLMNNAGLVDGGGNYRSKFHPELEFTNCINVFAPIVLTETMKEKIRKDKTRVVMLSSSAHMMVPSNRSILDSFKAVVNSSDKKLSDEDFTKQVKELGGTAAMKTYGMSKLHNKWYADYLKSQGIEGTSVHPGPVSTNFLHVYGSFAKAFATHIFPYLIAKYEDEGTWTQIYASLVKEIPSPSFLKKLEDKEKFPLVNTEAVFWADSIPANDQMTKLGRDLESANEVMQWTLETVKGYM